MISEDTRKKISNSMKGINAGQNNPFYGRMHSDEIKEKIATASRNQIWTQERKNKISKSKLNIPNQACKTKMMEQQIRKFLDKFFKLYDIITNKTLTHAKETKIIKKVYSLETIQRYYPAIIEGTNKDDIKF